MGQVDGHGVLTGESVAMYWNTSAHSDDVLFG